MKAIGGISGPCKIVYYQWYKNRQKSVSFSGHISDGLSVVSARAEPHKGYVMLIWSEWRLTVIAATVRIALVDILDLSEVDIPAGVFLHPAVGWG